MHVHLDFQLPTIPCDPTGRIKRVMLFPVLTNTEHTRDRKTCTLPTYIYINKCTKYTYTNTHKSYAHSKASRHHTVILSTILSSHNILIYSQHKMYLFLFSIYIKLCHASTYNLADIIRIALKMLCYQLNSLMFY